MDKIGFHEITKSGMLSTVGRFMTISKGVSRKKLDLDMIIETIKENGFVIERVL